MNKHYELLDHTADVAVKAYGGTLEEAFASAAEAMFELMTDKTPIEKKEKVTLEAESIDPPGLLVKFLSDLIVIHEVENMVLKDFTVRFTGENKLKAEGWGEKFVKERHGHGIHVKGVSYYSMEIHDGKGKEESFVRVVFDI